MEIGARTTRTRIIIPVVGKKENTKQKTIELDGRDGGRLRKSGVALRHDGNQQTVVL